ncbi:DRT111 protein [Hibiscus syriacus]|uniref:DRT111 protein n=1 Tax=Hibiscus syriacus TaxID=106335 RepID=A0A6A3B5V8_HIBSY|nr:DRT111 protein [Hibiscus syriacus]
MFIYTNTPTTTKNVLDATDAHLLASITLEGTNFLANAQPILSNVPANIVATLSPLKSKTTVGCFIGFDAEESKSHHVVPIGKLSGIRFMSIFRPFRDSLQPGVDDNVDLCMENGSTKVIGSTFQSCIYMHVGDDPYKLVGDAMKAFGKVSKTLAEGGCPPGIVIIDDGLIKPEENYKFREYESSKSPNKKGMVPLPKVQGMPPAESHREMVDELYQGLHSHLESVGIDGFKVDVIHLLEMLAEEYGGRVELAKSYYEALTASLRKISKGTALSLAWNTAMTSSSEQRPFHSVVSCCHMVHCAYNILWMGNFIHPDWDMFQSTHQCAEFHAASRAISGGPVYVSDSVGQHNFELLKSLALLNGSILRCEHYALPTSDCLFEDPLHDRKTMLKIWNLNKYTGVLGLFNCQGGGWCRESRRNESASQFSAMVGCFAGPKDIKWSNGKSPVPASIASIFAVYMFKKKKLMLMKSSDKVEVSLEPFDYELLRGAILSLVLEDDDNMVRIGVKGSGEIRVYASEKPMICKIDEAPVEFKYDEQMITVHVPWPNSSSLSTVEYLF